MNRIKEYRNLAGLTQEQLAERIGVTRGALSHYEKGRRGITIILCQKIIEALNTNNLNVTLCDVFPLKSTESIHK